MNELQELERKSAEAMGPCVICGKQQLETGLPLFYRVTVEQCGIDMQAVRQHVGLAMTLGGGETGLALAGVMGAQQDPVVVMNRHTANICATCAMERADVVVQIACGNGEDGEQ